jgi:hypothetical protein
MDDEAPLSDASRQPKNDRRTPFERFKDATRIILNTPRPTASAKSKKSAPKKRKG